ncbi:hypothetical protein M1M38_gp084 [Halorubrum tailed virus 27]|uniref:Uncharacterized protein n=1 Tax=Halorubrum tailed virus 27 TaxID=2878008 RepID=A0AAE8XZ17_9CAUD|nr:hypothetical protein M1M38_gp084 [Halorubrum tailed virus 27]UBF22777.1 hypothetical protein HRTV-27_gp84 [Halorubrum tailed virus 27]
MSTPATRARFECPCGNAVIRPRMMDRPDPECLRCHSMVWVGDV